MDFFEKIGGKLQQTSQQVKKQAGTVADSVKLSGMITNEEKQVNNCFLTIGKICYETQPENLNESVLNLIKQVDQSKARIHDYSEQLKLLKGVVKCQKCGGEVPLDKPFCSNCGSAMNVSPAETVPPGVSAAASPSAGEGGSFCGNCGAGLAPGASFCTSCGQKQ